MFHRVKADNQGTPAEQAPKAPQTQATKQEEAAQPAPKQDTRPAQPAQTRAQEQAAKPAPAPQPERKTERAPEQAAQTRPNPQQETSRQEKDKRFMNTRPDNQQDEQSYQADQQTQARGLNIPGAYQPSTARVPGAYPGAAYGARGAEAARAGQGTTLTVGQGITLSGEIEACDYLLVEGNVEASLKGARNLDVAEAGTFYGTVEIEKATIAGRFEGDLTVNGRLTIRSTGTITGSIAYRELEIEAGAIVDGKIVPLKARSDDSRELPAPKAKETAAAIAKAREYRAQKESAQEPANSEEGLFADSNKTAAAE